MEVISLVIQLLGLVLLIAGFRGSNRNMLLGAALLLWFGAGSFDFVNGFIGGVSAAAPGA